MKSRDPRECAVGGLKGSFFFRVVSIVWSAGIAPCYECAIAWNHRQGPCQIRHVDGISYDQFQRVNNGLGFNREHLTSSSSA